MNPRSFLDGRVALYPGDSLDVLKLIPENSIDSVVCDPPYHLTSIVKRFGAENATACKIGKTGAYARASAGFMGKQWDGGDIAFRVETWAAVMRVLKPGGHLVAFSGTRTYHRMACAIEDAGFEIRDQIGWAYGSGFPKSHDVSKGIDKQAGAQRERIVTGKAVKRMIPGADQNSDGSWIKDNGRVYEPGIEIPTTDAAKQWQGWGTALKPAWEPIVLARKPLIGTVAENVLRHGTGALNIDGCRIEAQSRPLLELDAKASANGAVYSGRREAGHGFDGGSKAVGSTDLGRWPANLVHDGSEEVLAAFPESAGQQGDVRGTEPSRTGGDGTNCYGEYGRIATEARGDGGSAARFFYTAKADSEDRLGSKHPTVKPLDLMQWLVRLVTPKGGTCLDPFAGTGTTGEAAWREGMNAVLIEREAEYLDDIARRMRLAERPDERAATARAKGKVDTFESLPLFGAAV